MYNPQYQFPSQSQILDPNNLNSSHHLPLLPKRTKSEGHVDLIVNYLMYPNINHWMFYLRKNILGAKYVICRQEIVFVGEERLSYLIKAAAYDANMTQVTDKEIKSALQIIYGKPELWHQDTEHEQAIPIRIISLPGGEFAYMFNKNCWLASIAHQNSIRAYFPKGMIDIYPSSNLNYVYQPIHREFQSEYGFNILSHLIQNELNVPEDCFLIVLSWLIQSIMARNFLLLELTGESKSGKSRAQRALRNLVDPNAEPLSKAPRKVVELDQQALEGYIFSYDDVDMLSDEVQARLADMMAVSGVKIDDSTGKYNFGGGIFVRHPIILNSVRPVVTDQRLLERTLTIELKPNPLNLSTFLNNFIGLQDVA